MRFWDSSAIVPLLVHEPASSAVSDAYRADPELMVWWGTQIECVSAIARLEREKALTTSGAVDAIGNLDSLARAWQEIQPVDAVRRHALRMLRVHPIRAADALQLAAARAGSEERPETLPFATLDDRLADAAQREGFTVLRPAAL